MDLNSYLNVLPINHTDTDLKGNENNETKLKYFGFA